MPRGLGPWSRRSEPPARDTHRTGDGAPCSVIPPDSACSRADSRSKLQSRVFRSVCCRSGRSRAPPVSSPHPVVEPGQQGLRWQQPDPGRGQLDGQRQPVQPPADLSDRPGVSAGQLETRGRGLRPLHEQAHRGVSLHLCGIPPAPTGGTGSGGTGNSCSPLSRNTVGTHQVAHRRNVIVAAHKRRRRHRHRPCQRRPVRAAVPRWRPLEPLAQEHGQVVLDQAPQLGGSREVLIGHVTVIPDPGQQFRQSRLTLRRRRLHIDQPGQPGRQQVLILEAGYLLPWRDPAVALPVHAHEHLALRQVGAVYATPGSRTSPRPHDRDTA